MFNVLSVIRNNNATFYDYKTGEKTSLWQRTTAMVIISTVLTLMINGDLKDFLAGVIPVQAILVGFSFSVMFFLMSAAGAVEPVQRVSLENELRTKRLVRLSAEIYHNISYFNLCAMVCLAASLILLAPDASEGIRHMLSAGGEAKKWGNLLSNLWGEGTVCMRWILFFLLLESGYTFARTASRVNYLFEQKLTRDDRSA